MAKKDKSKTPEVDLDNILDIDSFDFGDIDSQATKTETKRRKPAERAFTGAISGAKSTVMTSSHIKNFIRHALPKEYAETIDNASNIKDTVAGLYDDAVKDIKPSVQKIIKETDKLVPGEMKRSKAALEKMKKAFGVDEKSTSGMNGSNQDAELQAQLQAIFNVQTQQASQQHAEIRAEGHIRDRVEAKRFQSSFGLLNSINANLGKLSGYNEKVNSAFQKKSLELQYRSFFIQKEMADTMKRFYEVFRIQNEKMVYNTSLPDYVKMTKADIFKDVVNRKFAGNVSSMISNNQFIKQGIENLKKAGKEKISSIASNLGSFGDMLGGLNDAKEAMAVADELAESTGAEKQDIVDQISNLVGSMGADAASKYLAQKLGKKIPPKALTALRLVALETTNIRRGFKRLRKSKALQIDYSDLSTKGKLLNKGREGLGSLMDIFDNSGMDLKMKRNRGLATASQQSLFDNHAHKSITKIIPGYLSRIFRELQVLRTGNEKIELTEFSYKSDRFTSKTKLKAETAKDLFNGKTHDKFNTQVTNAVEKLRGDTKISPEARAALKNKIHDMSFGSEPGEISDLMDEKYLKTLPADVAKEIRTLLKIKFDSSVPGSKNREIDFLKELDKTSEAIVDVRGQIENYYNAGYGQILKEMGLIKYTKDGVEIDIKKYSELIKKGGNLDQEVQKKSSGANKVKQKGTFKQLSVPKTKTPKTAHQSQAASKPKTVSTSTKSAPTGSFTSFSVNAKQSLNFSGIGSATSSYNPSNNQNVILSSIKDDTGKIVERLDSIGRIAFNVPDLSFGSLKDRLKGMRDKVRSKAEEFRSGNWGDYFSKFRTDATGLGGNIRNLLASGAAITADGAQKAFGAARTGFSKMRGMASSVREKLGNLYSEYKDPVKEKALSALGKGKDLAIDLFGKVKDIGSDLINNKLPAGYAQLGKIASFAKEKAKDILDKPVDIYVKGNPTPLLRAVLMQAGEYFDQVSGKPITRPSQVKGPVINREGNVVLSFEDFDKGIVDKNGNPIKSISQKLVDMGKAALGKMRDAVGGTLTMGKNMLSGIGSGLKGIGSGIGFGCGSKMIHGVLLQIRDMLNVRLRGRPQKFADLEKQSESKLGQTLKAKTSSIVNKAKGFFGNKETDEDQPSLKDRFQEKGKTLFGSLLGGFNKLKNKFGKDKEEKEAKAETEKKKDEGNIDKQLNQIKERTKGNDKAMLEGDKTIRYKNGNVLGKMVGGVASAYELIKSGLSCLGGVLQTGGGLMGTAGKAALGVGKIAAKGVGLAAQGAWGAAKLAGRVGMAGLNAVRAAGAASSLGSIASMTGGVGSIAAGIGSILASPVVIGGLTVAAIGYGAYRAAKFIKRNKAGKFDLIRLRQYGLGDNMESKNHVIFELEQYLEKEALGYSNGQAKLLDKNLDGKKVLEMFDVTPEDEEGVKQVVGWFNGRFKPVFLKHCTAMYAVAPKKSIFEAEDLEDDKKEKYVNSIKLPEVYGVMISPFKDFPSLSAGEKEVNEIIETVRKDWKDNLNEDGTVKKGMFKSIATAAWSSLTKNDALEAAIKKGGIKGALAKVASYIPGLALVMNAYQSVTKILTTGASKIGEWVSVAFSKAMSALENVRFKVYGLKTGIKFKVSALRRLESYLAPMVSVNGKGKAVFNGDLVKVMNDVGPLFGVSATSERAPEWSKWFNQRFLPAYLTFMAGGIKATNKKDPVAFEDNFTLTAKFEVAKALMATPDIWKVSAKPWDDNEEVCDSESDCKEPLKELRDQAAKEVFNEPKKQPDAKPESKPIGEKPAPIVPPKDTPKTQQSAEKALNSMSEGEGKGYKANPSGPTGTLVGGKLNQATGPLADPAAGDQFIQLRDNSKLDGLNPEMLRNLKMMAAEYGQITGKSIPINSGVRSKEEQAALYKKDPSKAAKPGSSLHEFGLAVDSDSGVLNELDKLGLMRKYGFTRPIGQETWHMESAGIQTDINRAKMDAGFASSLIQNSLGRGGGGYATIAGSVKGHRDANTALALLKDSAPTTNVNPTDKDKVQQALTPAPSIAKAETQTQPSSATTTQPTAAPASKPTPTATIAQSSQANANNSKASTFTETEPGSIGKVARGADEIEGGDVRATIANAANAASVDPALLTAFAAIESGLKPDAKASTTTAAGLFQFTTDTWGDMLSKYGKKYNLDANASPTDPKAASLMAAEYLKLNAKAIHSARPNPNAVDLYLAHFLGGSGARKLLTASPDAVAAEILPAAAKNNPTIFYDNGRARTVGEVYSFLQTKVSKVASQFGITLKDSASTVAARTTSGNPSASTPSNQTTPSSGTPPTTASKPAASGTTSPSVGSGWPQPDRTTMPGTNLPPSVPEAHPQPVTGSSRSGSVFGAPKQGMPGIASSSTSPSLEQGKTSNYGDLAKLNTIDQTLIKSLDVQTQMLETLKQIVANASPDQLAETTKKLNETLEGLSSKGQSNKQSGSGATPIPKSAVNLRRVLT